MVRLALNGEQGIDIPDGSRCRVDIVLARTTPLRLVMASSVGGQ